MEAGAELTDQGMFSIPLFLFSTLDSFTNTLADLDSEGRFSPLSTPQFSPISSHAESFDNLGGETAPGGQEFDDEVEIPFRHGLGMMMPEDMLVEERNGFAEGARRVVRVLRPFLTAAGAGVGDELVDMVRGEDM